MRIVSREEASVDGAARLQPRSQDFAIYLVRTEPAGDMPVHCGGLRNAGPGSTK